MAKRVNLPTKKQFFDRHNKEGIALTYDDVRLRTDYTEIMPHEVSLDSLFSKHIHLKMHIVSDDIDSVKESKMDIELAKLGGLGVIHKNLNPEDQAKEVSRVKFYLNGRVDSPRTVREDQTVEEILNWRKEKKYGFHTFPVVDSEGKLKGILSENDFDFRKSNAQCARDIMTSQVITGGSSMSIKTAYKVMKQNKIKSLPLIDRTGKVVAIYTWSDVNRIVTGESKQYNVDKDNHLIVSAAIGTGESALERAALLIKKGVDVLVIDTAHGDSFNVIAQTLKVLKKNYDIDVVVGNISDPSSAERLCKAGADGIKVGQGPGSICTTRVVAGIGTPQVTAVYNCTQIAKQYHVPVCADGGLRFSGDIPIAIGAGAHNVMMGNMLAGTDEAPGELFFYKGKQWKVYRGMGSESAMLENEESRMRYLQYETKNIVPEGIDGKSEYKGSLENVIVQYVGGLRKGMGYLGAHDIEDLRKKAKFIRITQAGKEESHPHDIVMTKEPANYRGQQ